MNSSAPNQSLDLSSGVIVSQVSKTIKNKCVLNNVTAKFPPKQISGIRGHNGSGKTMLLRAIAGLISIDSGSIEVFGQHISKDQAFPLSMGFLIEPMKLWDNMSAMENLRLLASIRGLIGEEDIRNTLERVGLDPNDRRHISNFSLGMNQRLGIAQALMEHPQLIMLDEPTNALDADGVMLVRHILEEERERGATIIVVSHNGEELDALSDLQFVMSDGTIQAR